MDWNQSKATYYVDFALVPFLAILALGSAGLSWGLVLGTLTGFGLWSLVEYWIHRTLFHRFMRREHWQHHLCPRSYVTVPAVLTALAQITVYGALVSSAGLAWGSGLFAGIEAGYLVYIVTHDRIHHGLPTTGWLERRRRLHAIHHGGIEANFGVVTSLWDKIFGTYQPVA